MARKKKHEEHVNHERWLISYADFITLLFAFFVVMFSVSQVDSKKVGKFSESFQSAVGGTSLMSGSAGVFDGQASPFGWLKPTGKKGDVDDDPNRPILVAIESDIKKGSKELDELPAKDDQLGKSTTAGIVGLRLLRRRMELVLRLDVDVLFQSGSDAINPDALPMLEVIAQALKERDVEVKVEGHTDDRPINTAMFRSNWHLSAARATEVIKFFQSHGIPPRHLAASGLAEFRPVASNQTKEGRAKNRRVDIVIGVLMTDEERARQETKNATEVRPGGVGTKPATKGGDAQGS